MSTLGGVLRCGLRLAIYPAVATGCFVDYLFSRTATTRQRVDWLQRTARRHARWLGLRVRVHGEIPRAGLIVANHVSYLDIVGLSAVGAFAFVAKREVAGWPVFGAFARKGGTIFVNRESRGAVGEVAEQMRAHLAAEVPVVLFPEGTSTGGDRVLPFRSSLFEPVVELACPLTACGLRYTLDGGRVADEVAYWRDMSLAPHLLNLLRKTGVTLHLHFGEPRIRTTDRKALAQEMHAEVAKLAGVEVKES
jgi:1-acyl-sn-glycerol-3-phosphate acyltransferase